MAYTTKFFEFLSGDWFCGEGSQIDENELREFRTKLTVY